jgi:hypothetical protein
MSNCWTRAVLDAPGGVRAILEHLPDMTLEGVVFRQPPRSHVP